MSEQSSQTGLSPEGASPEAPADTPVQSVPEYVETLVTRARKAANRLAVLPTTVSQLSLLVTVHAHPFDVVTVTVPVPPVASND